MSEYRIEHPTNRPNFTIVHEHDRSVAFSYQTVVGLNRWDGNGWIVRENEWGPTTGKHLNYLNPDKSARLSGDAFDGELRK